jgi:hypothetical protein
LNYLYFSFVCWLTDKKKNMLKLLKDHYIIKFQTCVTDGKVSTLRHLSQSSLNEIPFFRFQLKGYLLEQVEGYEGTEGTEGYGFRDSLKPSPTINVVDLTVYNIHLEDLITYFKVKKTLKKGKPLTKEVFRGTHKLNGFFKLCDVFIDHNVAKMAGKFVSDYEDLYVLGEDLLTDIAEDYIRSVFRPMTYKSALNDVNTCCYKIEHTWNNYLKYITDQKSGSTVTAATLAPSVVGTTAGAALAQVYDETRNKVLEYSKTLVNKIDTLINVISEQALTRKLSGSNSLSKDNEYRCAFGSYVIGIDLRNLIRAFGLLENSIYDFNRRIATFYYNVSNINQYITFLKGAKKRIQNLKFIMPTTAFKDINTICINSNVDSTIKMFKNVNDSFEYLKTGLKTVSHIIWDKPMNFKQLVNIFVLKCPAIAKIIWETIELRKLLVYAYMRIPNTKEKRFIKAEFEELIPLIK